MATPGGQAAINNCTIVTFKSDGSSAYTKGHLVKLSADETVTPTTAQGEVCIGVVNEDVTAANAALGATVDVILSGVCWCIADEAHSRMGPLCVGGTTVTRVGVATTADYEIGIALTAAAGAADAFKALVDFAGASKIF